jgi:hypothetical protein
LAVDNLHWLRGQAAATARGSVSEMLDRVVTEARLGGRSRRRSALSWVRSRAPRGDLGLPLLTRDADIRSVGSVRVIW